MEQNFNKKTGEVITLENYLETKKEYIAKVFSKPKDQEEFIKQALVLISSNPALKQVEPSSLFMAILEARNIGLNLDKQRGEAWIIPYNGLAQFQIGVQGYMTLAVSSKEFIKINDFEVKEGELKGINPMTEEYNFEWENDITKRAKLKTIAYGCYFKLRNGMEKTIIKTTDELIKHFEKYSKSFKDGKFAGGITFEAMARKTVIKLAIKKYGAVNSNIARAQQIDSGVILEDGTIDYIDNPQRDIKKVNTQPLEKITIEVPTSLKTAEAQQEAKVYTEEERKSVYSRLILKYKNVEEANVSLTKLFNTDDILKIENKDIARLDKSLKGNGF